MEVTDSPSEHQCSPSSQRFSSHRRLEKDIWVCAPLGARTGALRMGGGGRGRQEGLCLSACLAGDPTAALSESRLFS